MDGVHNLPACSASSFARSILSFSSRCSFVKFSSSLSDMVVLVVVVSRRCYARLLNIKWVYALSRGCDYCDNSHMAIM